VASALAISDPSWLTSTSTTAIRVPTWTTRPSALRVPPAEGLR
jgi:hypothetical protein